MINKQITSEGSNSIISNINEPVMEEKL